MVKQEHSSRIGALEVWGNISRGNVWRREEEGRRKRERHFWNRRTEKEREQKIFKKKTKKQYDSFRKVKKSDGLKKHETKFIINSLVTREQLDGR